LAITLLASPPYPTEGTTPEGLYAALERLTSWVNTHRDRHNNAVGSPLIPEVQQLPERRAYTSLPVCVLFSHLLFMRKVRERWDHLVRSYEDDWAIGYCVRQRVILLASSAVLINKGFATHEQREFRNRTDLEDCQKTVDGVITALRELMEPEKHEPNTEAA